MIVCNNYNRDVKGAEGAGDRRYYYPIALGPEPPKFSRGGPIALGGHVILTLNPFRKVQRLWATASVLL